MPIFFVRSLSNMNVPVMLWRTFTKSPLAHQECAKIYYSSNNFVVLLRELSDLGCVDSGEVAQRVVDVLQPLHRFTCGIGKDNAAAIRSLVVAFENRRSLDLNLVALRSDVVEGGLLALAKVATEKPEWHLRARFSFLRGPSAPDERYAIDMCRSAASLKGFADWFESDTANGERDKCVSLSGVARGRVKGSAKKIMDYLRQWEMAAAAFEAGIVGAAGA
ncbi:hypothetical protein LTR36_004244 [Oleoguttula mirabilis]|uniref:Uncharacterized protein n=1 Tax=Oleoguttula mirabilis TaxID=1507867 RepID=A0AAV9JG87_9PEZI|nr:hypothetical protein LTR36_004244 [Oleoguttula mirabilis]